jgi:transcriptional regulator with PAS, ATPase and Fis domain
MYESTHLNCKPARRDERSAPIVETVEASELSTTLLGTSPQMVEVRDLIDHVAGTDATVLIRGESGTGKELVARALHLRSPRQDHRFIKVNCAALPADLLESEMFGFERGAFTGALQAKPGKFEFANQGTIFLDEIGEMSPILQAKLLHVLQDGEFTRLGGLNDVRVDVRVVAATNCCLERAVLAGRFREDLFFRLNVVSIELPPLRQRPEEIPQFTEHFLIKYAARFKKPIPEISQAMQRSLMEYDWPGNVRELENVVQRLVIFGAQRGAPDLPIRARAERRASASAAPAPAATPPEAPPVVAAPQPQPPVAPDPTDDDSCSLKVVGRAAARAAERKLILRMLTRTRWNRKEAAEILGISYKALLYKIKENRLDEAVTDPEGSSPDASARH